MKLILGSAGKSAVLSGAINADLYIDCRGMINPYRDPVLGGLTGDSPEVQTWIKEKNASYIAACEGMINTALKSLPSRRSYQRAGGKPLVVCFFCLAGVHRSRGMKNVIAELYRTHYCDDVEVEVL